MALVVACALLSAGLILLLRPWLDRYAPARPNERSMHSAPAAQGGGIAVIVAVVVGCIAAWRLGVADIGQPRSLLTVLAAAVLLALLGAADDLRNLPVAPRLLVQIVVAAAVLAALPSETRPLSGQLPLAVERVMLVVVLVGAVNVTNFMDGLDWMTVVETAPVSAAIGLFAIAGLVPAAAGLVALTLLGAMLGFAPFNRHVARLFLGDVGSLPVGLLLGWMLLFVAAQSLAAAILLPLYYIADASITLLRRLRDRERIYQAHRSHFYQRAVKAGFSVPQVTRRVLMLNIFLAALAAASLAVGAAWFDALLLAAGVMATAWLLSIFARGRT